MRICLVSEFFYPLLGGITEHVTQFASHCLKQGHEVTLLTSNAGPLDQNLVPKGLNLCRIGTSFPVFSNGSFARLTLAPRLGKTVREFFRRNSFDIIHVHPPMVVTLSVLTARYKTAPIVGTVHSYFEKSFTYRMLRKQGQKVLDNHNGFIAVSPCCIEAMRRYFRFDAKVIPNGVDPDYFAKGRRLPNIPNNKFTILFLGRLDPRNDLETLFQAFTILRKRGVPSRLVIAGDGPRRSYLESLVSKEFCEDVHFVGSILNERPDYLASADILCYPALRASFGITLLEAMSAGIPVVASDINGFKELVRTGKEGFLVPKAQPGSFADIFERLANDRNLCLRLGEQGRIRAAEFSWDKISGRILEFYRDTLGGSHAGEHA